MFRPLRSTSRFSKVFRRALKKDSRATLPPPARVLDCMELESRLLLSATPLGVETLVNTATANAQQTSPETTAAVAADANGNFVAVWASLNQDGNGWGIYGQRYNSNGVAQGSEFRVNTATVGGQEWASVAMDDAGNFVVTWSTDTLGDAGVRAQRYNASGVAQGGELQVNTNTTDDQQYSSIAMDSAGNFVITWSSINQDGGGWGVYAQRFNAAGVAQGLEFRVNTVTANDQMYSRVAMDADGDFVITWQSNGQDGGGWGIYGQRYNAVGAAQGVEFRANSTTANDQRFSSVDMAANGNFVVTWTSTNQDGSGLGIYMQRYNANGTTSGVQTLVNTTTAGDQVYSRVAVSPNGDFLVSWDSFNQDQASTWGIYAKKYTATGGVEELQFRVNTTTAGDQRYSGLALTAANNAVFVWSGNGVGDAGGVFMQRYTCNDLPVVTTTASALSYTENAGAVVVDGALTLTDADDTNMEGATISISASYVNGQDTLTFTNQNGITGSWNAGTGTMTLSGTATVANYRTALRSIRYTNSSDNPSTAVRTVSFVVNDGTANSAAATRNINITAVNDAPVLAGIEGASLAYTENASIPITASITVSDLDNSTIASATVQITGNYQNGQDLLAFVNTPNITENWNAATGLLTLSGPDTLANYQAALRSVNFTNTSDNPNTSNRTVTLRVNDGTTNSNTQTRTITVARMNDAPVNTVPGPQNTNEETILVFSSANGNPISIGDVDAGVSPLQVTLTATNGTLTLSGLAGLSFTTGDGTADATMTFTGTMANINTALNGLSYSPTAAFNGATTLQITTNDQGNTGSGGAQSDTDTVNITVNAVNDAPVVNTSGGSANYIENTPTIVDPALTLSDVDDTNLESATVGITGNFVAGQDTLLFTDQSGITGHFSSSTGVLTLTGTATVAQYQAALRSVQYDNTSDNPNTAARTVTFVVNDGALGSLPATRNVTLQAVNDAPVNTVPGAQTTAEDTALVFSNGNGNAISVGDVDAGASPLRVTLTATNGTLTLSSLAGLSFTTGDGTADATMTFTGTMANINASLNGLSFWPTAGFDGPATVQIATNDQGNSGSGGAQSDTDTVNITVGAVNDPPVVNTSGGSANYLENTPTIVDPALTLSDIDDTHLESATVTITGNFVAGQDTLLFTDQSGITGNFSGATGVLTLTGTATLAQYQAALRSVQYDNTSDNPNTATRTITFVVNDGSLSAPPETRDVTLQAVNDAPTNTVPGPQATAEDTALIFSSGNGNPILVDDPDIGTNLVEVTLATTNGTITLSQTNGLSFSSGGGTGDTVMTFIGTTGDINAALNGLLFDPTAGFNGAASLQIVSNDQGSTGSGGPQSDSDTVNITVNAVNDAPVNNVPGPQTTNEDATLVFSDAGGNRISIGDVDAASNPLQVTLTATNGTISLSQTTGLSFTAGDGVADAVMTFTGTLTDLNAALDGLSFLSAANFSGAAGLQIVTNDQGNTGVGGPISDTDTVNITVNAVNNAPLNSAPGPQTTNEDTIRVFSSAGGNLISISDIDAAGNPLQVTLTATNGTITLSQTNGLSFTVGSGAGDAVMTFTGTLADLNAALDGLTFAPTPDFNGAASLQITTNDQGNTGSGGPQSDSDTINITVNPVNDAPVVNTSGGSANYIENTPTIVDPALTLSDIDDTHLESATVTITGNFVAGQDTLLFTDQSGITGNWNGANGMLTLSGTATVAQYQAALRSVQYNNLSDDPNTATRTIAFAVNDGAIDSLSATRNVTVQAVNDAPIHSFPEAQTTNEDTTLVFSSAGGNLISISDIDAAGNPLQVTLTATNGTISLAGLTGLSFTAGDGVADAVMTFTGTLADLNAALDGLTFAPTPDFNGAASLQITTNDQGNTGSGGPQSDSDTVNITVNAVNDAPVNSVPGPQFTSEDTALVFSSAGGNLISISDIDAAGNPLQVTLTATNGTITLSQTNGLSFTVGSGAGDAVMTFTGTLADLNAALDGLSFSPTPSFNGSASLQIATNDQGNIGAGSPLSDSDTVNITVNAVDDAPILASVEPAPIVFVENDVPGNTTSTITIAEFDTGLISGATIQISANYRGGEDLLMFTNTATITGSWNAATGTLSLSGLDTASNYQDALRAVRYQNLSEAPDVATRTLTWTAFDDAANASNSVSRDVSIVSVNDLPTLSVPGSQSPLGNTIVFTSANGTAILVSDVDAGATPIEITLVASQGFITLPSTSGITLVEGTGANDTRLVISGTLPQVNQALDGLSFRTGATTSSLQIGVNDSAGGSGGTSQASAQISITAAPPAPPPVSPPSPPPIENLPETPGDNAAADNAALPVQAPPPSVSIDAAPQIDRSAGSQATIQAITPVSVVLARPTRTVAADADFVEPATVFGDDALRRASIYLADEALGLDLLDERRLWEEMQQISEALESELGSSWTVGAVVGAGAISAGYLLWLMRAGSLVASALSSLPVWNGFDPLPVLEFWERDQHDRRHDDDDDDPIVGGHRLPKVAMRG